jgi:hypothetical protein
VLKITPFIPLTLRGMKGQRLCCGDERRPDAIGAITKIWKREDNMRNYAEDYHYKP